MGRECASSLTNLSPVFSTENCEARPRVHFLPKRLVNVSAVDMDLPLPRTMRQGDETVKLQVTRP